ncbi:Disease resistance protein (TIR-NBS-LRR class) [Melia azedarach]|uniref:Disease resistance protein (TIR-NBS-LRR class) n=1 Tax=Melia azedarach TaxID=155640 RepID=A0ACC1XNR4_MELAZ|nr:Disease resistance protein (TIR-NBS-LRR class) [Melia azedarach]
MASSSFPSLSSPAPAPSSVTSLPPPAPPPPSSSSANSPPTSAPSSSNITRKKYDVYVSFRGEDTRENFISHFYTALIQNQITTFFDDQLMRGDKMAQILLNAIEGSDISVVILSKGYASSPCCLGELATILGCKEKYGQIVIPVFYRIKPSDVRNQTGTFGDEFSKLEEGLDKQRWRSALTEVSNMPGFVSHAKPDSLLVKVIVEDILKILNEKSPSDFKDLVGVESRIEEIESLLSYGSIEVDILSIWGIDGIGKTAIANAIFNKISSHFDGSYFIQNVREKIEKIGGLLHLRRELLSMLFEDGNLNVGIPSVGLSSESKRLSSKRVLVIFDDVTHLEQVESSIRILDWFMKGSLIIITTRNKEILKNCIVKKVYEMKELVDADALKLFSRHAFGQNYPDEGYRELSNKIIHYAQHIPLTLKVVGLFLFGRSKEEWESAINKLEGIPDINIQHMLRISYDGLENKEQNIFLKIACFLKGEDKDFIIKFLDAAGSFSSTEKGVSVLIDKCFIVVSDTNKITMHDSLQEMGRKIGQNAPQKGSRLWHLWHHENISAVSTYNAIDIEKIFVILDLVLEIPSAVCEQLSSIQKPQYALASMSMSFLAMLLCIVEFFWKCRKEKVKWKWRSTLPWLYYPSDKPFGNFNDTVGLICTVCQCIFATISYVLLRRHVDNPVKISFWPIVFYFGLLYSKILEKPEKE